MGDENPIRTLGDYSKPSHEGYKNTIELPVGNNVVPLRSDTIRLVQNGCSFHGLRSEDPNQHLKDFLKLVDSLDLDGENRERTRLRLFQFSLRDQASNWLERLPAGSITTWEDLTTRFLAQFFPPGRTAKLRNDILIWNDPRDFAKPVKAIALPQDVPSTSDRRLIKFENQVQRLMEAHLALTQPNQVNKVTTSCKICSGPHDTQYCMEDPEQAFVEYASSRTDEAGVGTLPSDTVKNSKLSTYPVLSAHSYPTEDPQCSTQIHGSINAITIHTEQQSASYDDGEKENKEEEDNPENIHVNPPTPPDSSLPPSFNTELICTKEEDGDVMFIEIVLKDDNSRKEEPEAGRQEVEYFVIFPTRSELVYHKYLMCSPIPSIYLRNPIIMEGCPSNLKIPCNIGHVHAEKAYIDLNSPLNIMTRMMYNWIMRRKLDPRENEVGEVVLFYNGLDVPVLFYNGLDVPTRQILDSRGAIPSKTAADVKVPTTPNIAHSKKKGKPSREVYYTQFGAPFQGGGYRATALGFYQRNNAKLVQEKKAIMRNLRKIMGESAKKTEEENSNLIRTGIRASRMGHKKTKEHQLSC
ncbi:MAK10-like protein [Tanacetum coccineum]